MRPLLTSQSFCQVLQPVPTAQDHWQTQLRLSTCSPSASRQGPIRKGPHQLCQTLDCPNPRQSIMGESKYTIHILTMLDACTNWIELALIPTANSKSCAIRFDTDWLCRYPCPTEVGHDNGPEFIGEEFQELLISYGIKSKPTTVKNPSAQALVERLHLMLGDHLCTSIYVIDDWHEDVNHLIQACAWAIRTTSPSNLPYNPSQFTFGMDMIFREHTKIEWKML